MDKVILAKDVILDGGMGSQRPNDNQIVFGSTGSGKSMSVIIPTLCHMRDSSFIGTFAKAGIVSKAVRFFRSVVTKLMCGILQILQRVMVCPIRSRM